MLRPSSFGEIAWGFFISLGRRGSDETLVSGDAACLTSRSNMKLGQNVAHVAFHGVYANGQFISK